MLSVVGNSSTKILDNITITSPSEQQTVDDFLMKSINALLSAQSFQPDWKVGERAAVLNEYRTALRIWPIWLLDDAIDQAKRDCKGRPSTGDIAAACREISAHHRWAIRQAKKAEEAKAEHDAEMARLAESTPELLAQKRAVADQIMAGFKTGWKF